MLSPDVKPDERRLPRDVDEPVEVLPLSSKEASSVSAYGDFDANLPLRIEGAAFASVAHFRVVGLIFALSSEKSSSESAYGDFDDFGADLPPRKEGAAFTSVAHFRVAGLLFALSSMETSSVLAYDNVDADLPPRAATFTSVAHVRVAGLFFATLFSSERIPCKGEDFGAR
jgi:hypothetical protein